MSDQSATPTTTEEARTWLAAFEKEFEAATQTNSILQKCMLMVRRDGIPKELALKMACIELCRRNAEYQKHINLGYLENPPTIILPPKSPDPNAKPIENTFNCKTKDVKYE